MGDVYAVRLNPSKLQRKSNTGKDKAGGRFTPQNPLAQSNYGKAVGTGCIHFLYVVPALRSDKDRNLSVLLLRQ